MTQRSCWTKFVWCPSLRTLRKWPHSPHGGVQSDAFGVVQLLIQEGNACLPILVTHEDPVIHVVHKVEVSGQPVNGHLLHVWIEKLEVGWGRRWDTEGARWSKNCTCNDSVTSMELVACDDVVFISRRWVRGLARLQQCAADTLSHAHIRTQSRTSGSHSDRFPWLTNKTTANAN